MSDLEIGRVFSYSRAEAKVSINTAPDNYGGVIAVEFTSPNFVNIAFPKILAPGLRSIAVPGWTTVHRGQQLDDLITALTYYRDFGWKELD